MGPIGMDVDLDELTGLQGPEIKILRISRLPRFVNSIKQPSLVVKVDFDGKILPKKAYFGFLSYPIREYNPPILRCYQCQRIGHMASGCTARPRCLVCGGGHDKNNCDAQIRKCANCGGPHIASSMDCKHNLQVKLRDRLIRTGISYANAAKQSTLEHPLVNEVQMTKDNSRAQTENNTIQTY